MSVITEKVLRSARTKLMDIADRGTFCEMVKSLTSGNQLGLAGYEEKLEKAQKTGEQEAVISGYVKIGGIPWVVFIMEYQFVLGSIGSVEGKKIVRAFEKASRKWLPIVSIFCIEWFVYAEGALLLVQMAKTARTGMQEEGGITDTNG